MAARGSDGWPGGRPDLALIELQAARRDAAEVLRQGAVRLGSLAPLRAWAHRGLRRALVRPAPRRPFALGGVTVEVSGDRLRLGREPATSIESRTVPVPGTLPLPEAGFVLDIAVGSPEAYAISDDPWRAVFDADVLSGPLLVRSRRAGDRMTPFGATGEHRVKRLLIEARLPRWERGRVPIVQAGPHIVWIGGVRRGAMAPITAATRRVVQLTLSPLAEARGWGEKPGTGEQDPARGVTRTRCIKSDSS